MEKIMLTIKFDFRKLFPTNEPNRDGIIFAEQAVKKAIENIKFAPFIIEKNGTEIPIGCIMDYNTGFLYVECYPEITIKDIIEIDKVKVVNDFIINAISLK